MLGILAESLLIAVRTPRTLSELRTHDALRREDEEWLDQRRKGRFDARMR